VFTSFLPSLLALLLASWWQNRHCLDFINFGRDAISEVLIEPKTSSNY